MIFTVLHVGLSQRLLISLDVHQFIIHIKGSIKVPTVYTVRDLPLNF